MSLRFQGSLVALLLAASCDGVVALSAHRAASDRADVWLSSASAEWSAAQASEAMIRRAWASEWQDFVLQLLQIEKAAAAAVPANVTAKAASAAAAAPAAKEAGPLAALTGLNLNLSPKSPADLAPALGMLKSVYEEGKAHIMQLNAREKTSKDAFAATQAGHDAKLSSIAARRRNHTMSKEMAEMGEKDEARLFAYWKRVRDNQHHQFHTALKLQHGTMSKVKGMIDMYERTMSGKEDKKKLAKEFAAKAGLAPEVVLLQEARQELHQFCQTSLAEVKAAQAELAH